MNGPPAHPANGRGRSRPRLLLGACAAVLAAATAMVAAPGIARAATCSNQTGTNNGYYYQMWSAGQGSACITVGSGGNSYSTTWSGIGDFVAGVGWNPGSNQTVSFNGNLSASGGTSLVSLYGWLTNPLVEYYVMDDYVGSPPTAGTYMGQVTSDGGTYNIYEHQQVNQPSIQGTATFEQYLAIRTSPVSSGTITTQNFFNAWASHGMNLGTLNYQILATEAWGGGSGSSNFTVSHSSTSGSGGGGSSGCTATLSAGSKGKYRIASYGLTQEEFALILTAQNSACAMCNEPFEEGQLIHVDHDHACCRRKNRSCECIRGLLCRAQLHARTRPVICRDRRPEPSLPIAQAP